MKKHKLNFRAAPGAPFTDEQAQTYGTFIWGESGERIGITPKEIVKIAKTKNSPIHNFFCWDDEQAADKYRIVQARQLTNRIEMEVKEADGGSRWIKAFYSVRLPSDTPEEERRIYVSAEVVANNEFFRTQIIEQALKEAKGWMARYKEYSELALIFGAIEQTQQELEFKPATEIQPTA